MPESRVSEYSRAPKAILSGQESLEEIILVLERNLAKKLGNSERLEKWGKVKFFGAARPEWLEAWKRFVTGQGLASLFHIHAGVQQTLEPITAFTLAMLRLGGHPQEILRKQAAVIQAAASAGDIEFFKQLGLTLRNRSRTKREGAFLSYSILCHWFAGLLWLMSDKVGFRALSAYADSTITIDAYRKARSRLGLKGYRGNVRAASIIAFDPETKSYQYGCDWT